MSLWLYKFQVKAICVNVSLPKSGDVRIVFVSDGKKKWHAFLCTDLELEASKILSYYSRRWAIEVFFKDAKQMLYLGKEQSNTFDAIVASYSLVMIRYLLLVYILNKNNLIGPLGPLFRDIADSHLQLQVAEKIWDAIKEFMLTSSELICYEIEPNVILHLLDIVENAIISQVHQIPAKL
ncbi:MAG: transposase [bacterium]